MTIDTDIMIAELRRDEGEILFVYDDATGTAIKPGVRLLGHPTIGVGRCLETKGISANESRYLLANDIAEYLGQMGKLPWFMRLDPVRQRAIINMRHQLGYEGLMRFPTMINALAARRWADAAAAGYKSQWRIACPTRAARVLAMILTGTDTAPLYTPPDQPPKADPMPVA